MLHITKWQLRISFLLDELANHKTSSPAEVEAIAELILLMQEAKDILDSFAKQYVPGIDAD